MARSASRIEYRCSFRQPLYEQIQEPDVFGIRISSSRSCVTCRDLVVAFSHDLLSGGVIVHTLHHRCSTRLIESVSVSRLHIRKSYDARVRRMFGRRRISKPTKKRITPRPAIARPGVLNPKAKKMVEKPTRNSPHAERCCLIPTRSTSFSICERNFVNKVARMMKATAATKNVNASRKE